MASVIKLEHERREALRWLTGQLEWEATLSRLRQSISTGSDDLRERDERPAA